MRNVYPANISARNNAGDATQNLNWKKAGRNDNFLNYSKYLFAFEVALFISDCLCTVILNSFHQD